jgi:hypothetical protein
MDPSEKEKLRQQHLDELWTDYRYSINKFDTQTIYISSGALAISLAFLKDIVPIEFIILLKLYKLSLFLFVIAMLFAFSSHLYSAYILRKEFRDIIFTYKEDTKSNIENIIINCTNYIVAGLIIAGIVLLSIFTSSNLSNYQSIKTNKEMNKIKEVKNLNLQDDEIETKAITIKPVRPELNEPKPNQTTTESNTGNNSESQGSNTNQDNKK